MGRGRKDSPEDWRRYKKLEQENEKLKREVSKLRKIVNSSCIDYLEEKEEQVEKGTYVIEYICDNCGKSEYKNISFSRADGEFEVRICLICSHRGPLKKVKNKNGKSKSTAERTVDTRRESDDQQSE